MREECKNNDPLTYSVTGCYTHIGRGTGPNQAYMEGT